MSMTAGPYFGTEMAAAEDSDELVVFRKQDAIAAQLRRDYMALKVSGADDADGMKVVHDARIVVRDARIAVEETRKQLKAGVLERGRKIDAEAKRVTALLEPIETHLQQQEDIVLNEQKRLKQAEEDARRAALQKRLDTLAALGMVANPLAIDAMSGERFEYEVTKARDAYDARQMAEAEAARKRQEEEAALQAERERQAIVQRQQKEEADRIRAEQAKLDAEKARVKAEAEAAERLRVDAEQRQAREAAAQRAAEEQRIAREKAEAERPQREKLLAVAVAVRQIDVPDGPGAAAVRGALLECEASIRQIANGAL